MTDSFENNSKRLAVRIGLDGGTTLIGSGVVLTCEMYGYALIFTAAHVFDEGKDFHKKLHTKKMHFCFAGTEGEEQDVELSLEDGRSFRGRCEEGRGYVYKHPDYSPRDGSDPFRYPKNDGAIVLIPYYDWMRGCPKFQISEEGDGDTILVGFPIMYDNKIQAEEDRKFLSYRGNIFYTPVKVENQKNKNLVIKSIYANRNPFKKVERKLDGLSGGGVIANSNGGLVYCGAFVSTKNEGEDSYFGASGRVFLEIVERYKLKMALSPDLDFFVRKAGRYFEGDVDEKARQWFLIKAKSYFGKGQHDLFFKDKFVESAFLSCEGYRPLCESYYANKLIGTVLLGQVYGIDADFIVGQMIQIGESEEAVKVEHICSEKDIRQIVTEIIQYRSFSAQGLFTNGTIFIFGNRNQERSTRTVSRGRSRRIVESIVKRHCNEWSNDEEFSDCVYNLLEEKHKNEEFIPFSTIEGDLRKADIGFVGLGKLEEIMKETKCEESMLNEEVRELMEKVWRE